MSTSEVLECPVCYEPESAWEGSTKAKCGHAICMQCFLEWTVVKRNLSCPMCRGNVRTSRPEDSYQVAEGIYRFQDAVEETFMSIMTDREEEDRYDLQARLHNEEVERREAHETRVRLSAVRRRDFLEQQIDSHITHCMTCTDPECMSNHTRQTTWLVRGKLVPLPPRIKSLDKLVLGYMLGKGRGRMGSAMRGNIEIQLIQLHGSLPHKRRINGLLIAIQIQQSNKEIVSMHRERTKGSVALRLTNHADGLPAIVAQLQTKKPELSIGLGTTLNYMVKLFKGYTPPKRRARVGDIHERSDGMRGMCVGWNLWAYSDGSRLRLDGNRWRTCD